MSGGAQAGMPAIRATAAACRERRTGTERGRPARGAGTEAAAGPPRGPPPSWIARCANVAWWVYAVVSAPTGRTSSGAGAAVRRRGSRGPGRARTRWPGPTRWQNCPAFARGVGRARRRCDREATGVQRGDLDALGFGHRRSKVGGAVDDGAGPSGRQRGEPGVLRRRWSGRPATGPARLRRHPGRAAPRRRARQADEVVQRPGDLPGHPALLSLRTARRRRCRSP